MQTSSGTRAIIHLDMDAFYAAVEILDNSELKGRPVIVGGSKERGVVSSACYEARTFGIHSAQPVATAARLCPHGVFLPVRMRRYKEVSRQIFKIFSRFTPLVEPLSLDEAFLDVTGSTRLFGPPEVIGGKIKQRVVEEIGLTVSAGVAPSKFVAKIASDMQKPNGLTIVPEGQVKEFLEPLPIEKLWGVGLATRKILSHLGVRTIGNLADVPVELLARKLGKQGLQLYSLASGVDERDVRPERGAKSVGHEETYVEDVIAVESAKRELLSLATRVAKRLRRQDIVAKTVTLKVKYHDFVQITRSRTLPESTDDGRMIYQTCCDLLAKTEVGNRPIRLLGVSVSQLNDAAETKQLALFNDSQEPEKRRRLNKALDTITDKYGNEAVVLGTLLEE